MQQNERKKGDQGFKTLYITKPYQRLGWSLHPLSSSTSRRSAEASGIHSRNHLQRESYLHLPVVGLKGLISATRSLSGWDLPDPHACTPGEQRSLWLLSQLLWQREGLPQMAVSEFSQTQIGPLPLFAGNRPQPWSTPELSGGTCRSEATSGSWSLLTVRKEVEKLRIRSTLKAKEHIMFVLYMWWFCYLFPLKLTSNNLDESMVSHLGLNLLLLRPISSIILKHWHKEVGAAIIHLPSSWDLSSNMLHAMSS